MHRCKAHAKVNRKIKNSTPPPCKIVTDEDFNLKLGTRDYVVDITHYATFGSNRSSGGFPPNRRKYNTVVTVLFACMSRLNQSLQNKKVKPFINVYTLSLYGQFLKAPVWPVNAVAEADHRVLCMECATGPD